MVKPVQSRLQQGVSLIESLIAIIVLALGLLGILGFQMRVLADSTTSVRRAQAIRLINDLSERMTINPNAMLNMARYTTAWDDEDDLPAGLDCATNACTAADLATYDAKLWLQSVRSQLPAGDASVFLAEDETIDEDRRQLGVMISWREREASSDSDYTTSLNASIGGGDVSCPTGKTCHLQYLPVAARCAVDYRALDTTNEDTILATTQFFCAG